MNKSPYRITGGPSGRLVYSKGGELMKFTPEFKKAVTTFVTPGMMVEKRLDELEKAIHECLVTREQESQ